MEPGTIFILALLALVVLAGWLLRRQRWFWRAFASVAVLNIVLLNLFPDRPHLERFFGPLYWPVDWLCRRFGYGIHDPTSMFLGFIAFPFFLALAIEFGRRISRRVPWGQARVSINCR